MLPDVAKNGEKRVGQGHDIVDNSHRRSQQRGQRLIASLGPKEALEPSPEASTALGHADHLPAGHGDLTRTEPGETDQRPWAAVSATSTLGGLGDEGRDPDARQRRNPRIAEPRERIAHILAPQRVVTRDDDVDPCLRSRQHDDEPATRSSGCHVGAEGRDRRRFEHVDRLRAAERHPRTSDIENPDGASLG